MTTVHLRALAWPLAFAIVAVVLYDARIRRSMVDFGVYRTAAGRAVAAEPLYREEDGHYKFKYLPAFALAMAPFATLDGGTAKALWFGMSVGLLAAFLRWSIWALPNRRRAPVTLLALTIVIMAKFYGHELTLGQSNILLGTLVVAALVAVEAGASLLAGVLFGLAIFVKPYAVILLPWMAVSCGAAAVLASTLVVIAGLVLPALVYGWSGNLALLAGWYHTVMDSTASTLVGGDSVSVAAMWGKWLGVGTPATVLAALSGLALLALAVAVRVRRRNVERPEYLEVALLMLLIPLLSPQGWDYVLLLSTPAVVLLIDRWSDLTLPWRAVVAASLAVMGLTIYDVMGRELYGRFMALSIVSVCGLLVAVSLAHLRRHALA
jgi:Glycosyltransferase family 87